MITLRAELEQVAADRWAVTVSTTVQYDGDQGKLSERLAKPLPFDEALAVMNGMLEAMRERLQK